MVNGTFLLLESAATSTQLCDKEKYQFWSDSLPLRRGETHVEHYGVREREL